MDFGSVNQSIANWMRKWGVPAARISLAIIFFWFGILKPFGYSAATDLVRATVAWLPFGSPDTWLVVIGWWEVIIGITYLFRRTTPIAIGLMLLQMVGTFMPIVFLPDVTFQNGNYLLPTLEGQYIIKNLLIISAALIVGGTFSQPEKKSKASP